MGELRLTVGAHILITEAAGNLKVALHPGHHEQLLQLLGRLRQGVEAAGLESAGHQEISRALGRAFNQDGSLDFQKSLGVQKIADVLDHPVAQDEVLLHSRPSQVEVAIPEAQTLVGPGVVGDIEGRREGAVQHRYI